MPDGLAAEDVLPTIAAMGRFDDEELVASAVASIVNDIASSIEDFSRRDEGYHLDVPVGQVALTLLGDLERSVASMLSEDSLMRFGHVEPDRIRIRTPEELAALARELADGEARRATGPSSRTLRPHPSGTGHHR